MADLEKKKGQQAPPQRIQTFRPLANIVERADGFLITADVPGTSKEHMDITLEKDTLTLKAFVNSPKPPEGFELGYSEYEVGNYERSFAVSSEINRDGITAKLDNGVLVLQIPKAKEKQPKQITITT